MSEASRKVTLRLASQKSRALGGVARTFRVLLTRANDLTKQCVSNMKRWWQSGGGDSSDVSQSSGPRARVSNSSIAPTCVFHMRNLMRPAHSVVDCTRWDR